MFDESKNNNDLIVYRHKITVGKDVLDGNKHVNNVVYVQWMQDAAVCHSRDAGCTQATKENGAIWVARTHWIKYCRPAYEGEEITVFTWISNLRTAVSLRKYKFVRDSDRVLLAEGETDWAYVDAVSGRPRAIPENVMKSFTIIPEDQEDDLY